MITLLYFAGLKEKTGLEKEQIQFSGHQVKELVEFVQNKYENFSNSAVLVAVNEEYALPEDVLQVGDTVAFIPPVSGG
ncbi:molybdopterin converting factor subunit 1 [Psychrobacillus sp.]|uniref:molybdopterin converting factor subunit 1 n=1 Tax=Psychrobacillus sp. TaxID=1871623 RepID=UPI0028BE2721|nr:molybdopterin converting factor subunit 1 [Psychrobacillus sp.]